MRRRALDLNRFRGQHARAVLLPAGKGVLDRSRLHQPARRLSVKQAFYAQTHADCTRLDVKKVE